MGQFLIQLTALFRNTWIMYNGIVKEIQKSLLESNLNKSKTSSFKMPSLSSPAVDSPLEGVGKIYACVFLTISLNNLNYSKPI